MPVHIETLSLISAVQAAVLAMMLWAGTHGDAGRARTSLSLRAAALAVEAGGWAVLAVQAYIPPAALLLGGNGLNLIAHGMGVIALRMLLGERLRGRLVLAVAVIGWLGVAWFGVIQPDYRDRVLWGSAAIMIDVLLSAEALRSPSLRRGSRARAVLILICAMAAVLLIWRNGLLWFGTNQPDRIVTPSSGNFFYVMFSGLQPLFASIGFLLLYNEILQQELHTLARIDPLTGVNNRLALTEATGRLLAHAARRRRPVGVLMLDADHFKGVNDRFGHGGGDKVLLALVSNIGATLADDDLIGRVGGEEFVVLSPGTCLHGALALAERIRLRVEATPLLVDGHVLQLTVSVGVTVAAPGEQDVAAVWQRADAALYAAKHAGRNRVMSAGASEPEAVQPA
jgi:diguanylate cyclase (GGDEF)-like protein